MRHVVVWMVIALVMVGTSVAFAAQVNLPAVRDAKIACHRQEVGFNFGKANRLQIREAKYGSGEMVIVDFDRDTLRGFLKRNEDKELSGKLTLFVSAVGAPAKVEVCTLISGNDWGEGNKMHDKADKGECSHNEAKTGEAKWANAEGKDVANFRDLFYDKEKDEVLTTLNSKSVEVTKKTQQCTIEIDAEVLKELANNENCRGLIIFTRTPKSKVAFFSRDQNKKSPSLTVTAK
jgi:hypothetical protein